MISNRHLTVILDGYKISDPYDLNKKELSEKVIETQQGGCCSSILCLKTERLVVSRFAEAGLRQYQTQYGIKPDSRQSLSILKTRTEGLEAVLEACKKKDPSSVLYWRGDRNVRRIITDVLISRKLIANYNKEQERIDMSQSSKNLPVLKKSRNSDSRQVVPSISQGEANDLIEKA
ncbi:MAG: hypothetical protein JSS09_05500 [Verrucomicrobia bacterium]|nr:hypothetical protein [Verrucomicrobiota bacterium]